MPGLNRSIYNRENRSVDGVRQSKMYYGSRIFSGQRFFGPTTDAFDPVVYGATRTIGGAAPIPTVIPPSAMQYKGGMGGAYVEEGVPSGGGSPWNFMTSPLPMMLILLVFGLFWLHYVHFSK